MKREPFEDKEVSFGFTRFLTGNPLARYREGELKYFGYVDDYAFVISDKICLKLLY